MMALGQVCGACRVVTFVPLLCPIFGTMCILCVSRAYIFTLVYSTWCILVTFSFVSRPPPLPDAAAEQRRAGRENLPGGGALARNGILWRTSGASRGKYAASDSRSVLPPSPPRYRCRHALNSSKNPWGIYLHLFVKHPRVGNSV